MTAAEFEVLEAAAESYMEEFTIDSYVSEYTFQEGVIEVTEPAEITTVDGITTVSVMFLSKEISVGDKFVAYCDGLAIPYRAEEVSFDGTSTVITVTELDFEEAIATMNVQQEMDTNPANYVPSEGTELIFIEEESGEELTQQQAAEQMAKGSKKVYIPKFNKTVDLGGGAKISLSVELKNAKLNYKTKIGATKGSASVWIDGKAEVTGSLTASLVGDDGFTIVVGSYGVPGVGGIELAVKADATGKLSIVKRFNMKVGVKANYNVAKRKISFSPIYKVTDRGSSFNAEISAAFYLQVRLGLYGNAMPVKGFLYGRAGFKSFVSVTTYSEVKGSCVHFSAHIFAEIGVEVSWSLLGIDQSYEKTKELFSEDNSPVRCVVHYEDGKFVPRCTRTHLDGSTTGSSSKYGSSGYYTGSGSSYSSSGMGSYGSSTGYDEYDKPYTIYSYSLNSDNQATITKYSGNVSSLTIPLKLDGYEVVAIGSNAFAGNKYLQTVIIQDNITSVGYRSFKNCTSLRNLPNTRAVSSTLSLCPN